MNESEGVEAATEAVTQKQQAVNQSAARKEVIARFAWLRCLVRTSHSRDTLGGSLQFLENGQVARFCPQNFEFLSPEILDRKILTSFTHEERIKTSLREIFGACVLLHIK